MVPDLDDPRFDRQPPQDLGAEQSVLGGMLLSKDAIADVVESLGTIDFYRPAHQAVFEAILHLYGKGEPADPITVSAELERRGELVRIGGAPYLHTLLATVPTAANAGYYARIVAEKAVLRRIVEAGTRAVQLGYNGAVGADLDEVIDQVQKTVHVATARRGMAELKLSGDTLQATMNRLDLIATGGIPKGLQTGLVDLDEITNGLQGGQMIIVAARPGIGKSTLGLDVARHVSVDCGLTSAVFSLEMSADEINQRMLSAIGKVNLKAMRGGKMTDADWVAVGKAAGQLHEAPLWIDDSPNLTINDIRTKARRLKQSHDLKLMVVDYLQLMVTGGKTENRQQEVSQISRVLKLIAKELDIPVIAISQLNRGVESRQDKRPLLSDLRESGSLEQDADMVILINRPDAYDREDPRAGEADLILAKHRAGPTATVTVAHQLHYSRFANLSA
ncbi:replicative DNA helicase [Lentzea atacamensis]|nr:replicative DNA helicase [Lentzea atacamensis]